VALATTGGLVWAHTVSPSGANELSFRPPGAKPEPRDFLASCIKCGECVEACPFDTLKLAKAQENHAIGAPYFEPREVPCYMCPDTPCIAICPTDALEKQTPIEEARMGVAVLSDQQSCLAFQGLRCEVCYRACPLMGRAISLEFRPQERTGKHAYFLPIVDAERCTGCGMCEHACILEEAAIKVLPHHLAQGKIGSGYRLGWEEETEISRDFVAPEGPPSIPAFEGSLERVLREMDDLSGIEEP
jgi:ferredoxin-type protein NapG